MGTSSTLDSGNSHSLEAGDLGSNSELGLDAKVVDGRVGVHQHGPWVLPSLSSDSNLEEVAGALMPHEDDFRAESSDDEDFSVHSYRLHVLSQLRQLQQMVDRESTSIKRELRENYVRKDIFELTMMGLKNSIDPIKRVGWFIFCSIGGVLLVAILNLVIQSKGLK